MHALIQISDTHFGTEQPPVVAALLQFVAETRPEVIVLSGDITQRARRHQFEAARRFRDALPASAIVALPGNHDIPLYNVFARVLFPYAGFRRVFGDNLEPQYESEAFVVIGVNTTRPRRHVDGEISHEQVRRVSTQLDAADARKILIVVTHQPVHVIRAADEKNLVHGHEAAVREWSKAGADLIMGGHIHLPYVRSLSEHCADVRRRVWAVQAGTAVSHRVRHGVPNSVNVVRRAAADASSCTVERWDYDHALQRFSLAQEHRLELDRTSHRP